MTDEREIGGYIEFERFEGHALHEKALALNCGRGCISYLVEARQIREVCLPAYICSSVIDRFKAHSVKIGFYHIGADFAPIWETVNTDAADERFFYLVNYYGQLGKETIDKACKAFRGRVIVDMAQGFFDSAPDNVDTLYTARKFFGVSDGAYLYTDARLSRELVRDESYDRMTFLMGRLERTASEFYAYAKANNRIFDAEPAKAMSLTTQSLLAAVDYDSVRVARDRNYAELESHLGSQNTLQLRKPRGAFAYPLMVADGVHARKALAARKIYVPTLWPNVLGSLNTSIEERRMTANILPLPVDHRYTPDDMRRVVGVLEEEDIV